MPYLKIYNGREFYDLIELTDSVNIGRDINNNIPCRVSNVPVGTDMRIMIEGSVSGEVCWRGEETGILVSAGQTTHVGTITMNYVGDDHTPPYVVLKSPPVGTTAVSINSIITATFSEKIVSASINNLTFILESDTNSISGLIAYDPNTLTAIFTPEGYLLDYTLYRVTLTKAIEDMAGNQMEAECNWSFITGEGLCKDTSGTWTITEEVDGTGCGEGHYTQNVSYVFIQKGCSISVNDSRATNKGIVKGNQILFSGSYSDNGGMITASINLSTMENTINGSAPWTWTDGNQTCSGKTSSNSASVSSDTRIWVMS